LAENRNAEETEQAPKELLPDSAVLSNFIEKNAVVVDKTPIIRRLFESPISTFFLSRPRRFGKSLLLDTMKNIAECNREFFTETEIGKDGSGFAWKRYPVILLNFGGISHEPEAFRRRLLTKMDRIIHIHGLDIGPVKDIAAIEDIIGKLSDRHSLVKKTKRPQTIPSDPRNVVFLVDEYDFPLLDNINNSDRIDKIREMLHEFYSTINNCERMLRLTFITGISKFSKLSIFSGLNNIVDISLDPTYSTICGFTEDEIKSNFASHILLALSKMKKYGEFQAKSTAVSFFNLLKYWYDGYTWGNSESNVYNPFSVVNCLLNSRFDYYWYDSGTSLAAYKFRHMADVYFKIISKSLNIKDALDSVSDIKNITIESLLFQTGYLTIDNTIKIIANAVNRIDNAVNAIDSIDSDINSSDKIDNAINTIDSPFDNSIISDKEPDKIIVDTDDLDNNVSVRKFKLKCPNNEIFYALIQDFIKIDSPFPGFNGSINQTYSSFVNSFNSLDADECEKIFSSFLGQATPTLKYLNEETFQNLLLCLLNISESSARAEQLVGSGRCDIIYKTPDNTLIVTEIKYQKGEKPKKLPRPKVYPPLDAKLPAFLEMPEQVNRILENLIADAFMQIVTKKYVRPFYKSRMKTIACTIAIHGYNDCLFKFYSIDWSSKKISQIRSFSSSKSEINES
jgi:hypothetical protein